MGEQAEKWTVGRLLNWTTEFFKGKGIESPLLDAQILLAKAMEIKRIELYTNFTSEPTESQRAIFRDFVKRRGAGEPAAYLVGVKEFYSIPFQVNSHVLIPRPETEQLVLEALDRLKILASNYCNDNSESDSNSNSNTNLSMDSISTGSISFCDVGTGSGAIAVAVAKNYSRILNSLLITAIDISQDAIEIAKMNAGSAGVLERINFVQSDLFERVDAMFDIIASNPPYVSCVEYENLPVDIKNYEPKLALLAGESGTEVIERLSLQAFSRVKSGGFFLLEISPMIAESVKKILIDGGWQNVRILYDGRVACCDKLK
ncbi:MAG: peptide chain release factor N(5)-glutamine methyltransferase [Planctomycetaceae bacterium]|jgi:release factor glutamine methyltransferase|nr:peptide chain release factor N(5)-glutamine methyltransferase [Planctomycetaceae bacterium]